MPGFRNALAYALSRFQNQCFKKLAPAYIDTLPFKVSSHLLWNKFYWRLYYRGSYLSHEQVTSWLVEMFCSLVCWQFRLLNAPPASASKRVKSPTCPQEIIQKFSHLSNRLFKVKYRTRHNRNSLKSRKAVVRRFLDFQTTGHSREPTFNGLFQRLSNAPTEQWI